MEAVQDKILTYLNKQDLCIKHVAVVTLEYLILFLFYIVK